MAQLVRSNLAADIDLLQPSAAAEQQVSPTNNTAAVDPLCALLVTPCALLPSLPAVPQAQEACRISQQLFYGREVRPLLPDHHRVQPRVAHCRVSRLLYCALHTHRRQGAADRGHQLPQEGRLKPGHRPRQMNTTFGTGSDPLRCSGQFHPFATTAHGCLFWQP